MITVIGITAVLLLGVVIFRLLRVNRTPSEFPKYESDLFWNVVFEWDWRRGKSGFEIVPESVKKICPHCHEELTYKTEGDYYFLFCNTCKFISSEYFQEPNASDSRAEEYLHRELQLKALKNI